MTLQHLSVRGNNHTGFDRVLSLQMTLIVCLSNYQVVTYKLLHIMSGHLSEIA